VGTTHLIAEEVSVAEGRQPERMATTKAGTAASLSSTRVIISVGDFIEID